MKHRIFPVLLLALAVPALAQPPAKAKDFARTGEYLLLVDGKPVPVHEIYKNEDLPAYLVLSPALPSPVLLTPRTSAVETVPAAQVVRQQDGTVRLAADAGLKAQGKLKLDGEKVAFTADGRKGVLSPNPPLLGLKKAPVLKSHSPEYVVGARNYKPNAQALAALRKSAKPARVRVFFGSWCPHCRELLPHLLRVEEELKGAPLQFEYYGLPKGGDDPEVKKYGIDGVPIGIVFVDGKEVGRLKGGDDWDSPETRLNGILNGKAAAGR